MGCYAVLEQAVEAQDESLFSSTIVFAVKNSINRLPLDAFYREFDVLLQSRSKNTPLPQIRLSR